MTSEEKIFHIDVQLVRLQARYNCLTVNGVMTTEYREVIAIKSEIYALDKMRESIQEQKGEIG